MSSDSSIPTVTSICCIDAWNDAVPTELRESEQQLAWDLGKALGTSEGCGHQVSDMEGDTTGADVLILLTEWQHFAQINCPAVAALMYQPSWLLDARAKADSNAACAAGLNVWTVGEGQR